MKRVAEYGFYLIFVAMFLSYLAALIYVCDHFVRKYW